MGKKKAFIDRKAATTYSLVYNDADGDSTPQNALVPHQKPDCASDCGTMDAAFFRNAFQDVEIDTMSEARRQENLNYGFPDDGYDYLKHLRSLARGPVEQASDEVGPSEAADRIQVAAAVFIPAPRLVAPKPDVQTIDARGESAVIVQPGLQRGSRGADKDVTELEELVSTIELNAEVGTAEGEGDLLDDFVFAALGEQATAPSGHHGEANCAPHEQVNTDNRQLGQLGSDDSGSCDTGVSGAEDDRFEDFLSEYEDDELGDLQGGMRKTHSKPGNDGIITLAKREVEGTLDYVDVEALKATKALYARRGADLVDRQGDVWVHERPREKWDCESVLSIRSTATQGPRTIIEPVKIAAKDQKSGPVVMLSSKTGLPVQQEKRESALADLPTVSAMTPQRKKGETAEERAMRKAAVKANKRQAREAKKSLKTLYKQEELRQQKMGSNSQQTTFSLN